MRPDRRRPLLFFLVAGVLLVVLWMARGALFPFVVGLVLAYVILPLVGRVQQALPEGVGVDGSGTPTQDAKEVLQGGVLPFGGYKGFGLSLAMQTMGLLAGAALPRGNVQDYGFLFITFAPDLLMPADQFAEQVTALIDAVKATPRKAGVDEIRIPSERAFRERDRRRHEGIVLEQKVVDALNAL